MTIPEAPLETWAKTGAGVGSAQTYNGVKDYLNDSSSPYHGRSKTIFLQGSYGNDTNVWKESDVDIVICLTQTYYADTGLLSPAAKIRYEEAREPATYTLEEFKTAVLAWLKVKYGADVKAGTKAIAIKGNGSRRDADVIVCAHRRRYRSDSNGIDGLYDEGICFYKSDGALIENFPKQHSANCTEKHQESNSWFKPMVRIYKNMRNRMVDDKFIESGIAPSYFIEGMLWNVPVNHFGTTYNKSFVETFTQQSLT